MSTCSTRCSVTLWLVLLMLCAREAQGEMYVAGQVGGSFPFDLRNVEGTGTIQGVNFNDLELSNTLVYGGKLGYFFEDRSWNWVGVELEAFASNPHVKQQEITAPGGGPTATTLGNGAHVTVITTALNVIARSDLGAVQPYAGVGFAFVNARVSDEGMSISDSSPGLNLLAGVKAFVTKQASVFLEGKYTFTSFQFNDAGVVGAGIKGIYSAPAVVAGVAWHFK